MVVRSKGLQSTTELFQPRSFSSVFRSVVCVCSFSAFAELQVDMSEVANDILSSSGLPFRDYGNYSVRVLFASDKWQSYIMPEYVS